MFYAIYLEQATCTLRYNLGHMFVKTTPKVENRAKELRYWWGLGDENNKNKLVERKALLTPWGLRVPI